MTNAQLYHNLAVAERNLVAAEKARDEARQAVIDSIRERLGTVTPYAFAKAAGLNWGNFHRVMVQGEWNAVLISQAITALDGAPVGGLLGVPQEAAEVGGGGKKKRKGNK